MLHKNYGAATSYLGSVSNYGFSGKELQEESGIAWLDFGSRNYDAELGRWFNTDPQNQFNSPYLYAYNNPISSVDPDGEWAFLAAVVGGAIIGATTTAIANPRADFGDILGGAGIGAFSGAVTFGIGSAGMSAVQAAGFHGVFQGILSGAQGGDFWSSAAIGAGSSLAASGIGEISRHPAVSIGGSAVVGGFISEVQGGSFTEGFATGLTISAFNHYLHKAAYKLDNPDPKPKKDYKAYFREMLKRLEYAELTIAASHAGAKEYRESLSVLEKVGKKGNLKFLRYTSTGSRFLGGVGYVAAPITTYFDYQSYKSNKITKGRFTYRTVGTFSSLGTGAVVGTYIAPGIGTLAGFTVGLGFTTAEMMYDLYHSTIKWEFYNSFNFNVYDVARGFNAIR